MTPDPLDFVNLPEEITDELVEKVIINDADYPLQEFTQAERHLWLKIRDEADLMSVVREFSGMRKQLDELSGGVLVEKKQARIDKLDADINKFIDTVGFDEWNSDHDAKLTKMIEALEAAKREMAGIQEPLEDKAMEQSAALQKRVDELRERQQLVYLKFIWLLAKDRHKEKRSWEEYLAAAKGSDRSNATEVVEAGNFTWETQGRTRPQNRAARRASSKN